MIEGVCVFVEQFFVWCVVYVDVVLVWEQDFYFIKCI